MRVTIKDVAKEAGVSITTVSLVLNGKHSTIPVTTRNKVLAVAKSLDYHPNQQALWFKNQESNLLLLLVPNLNNNFYADVAQGALLEAQTQNFMLVLSTLARDRAEETRFSKMMKGGQFEGALIVSRKFNNIKDELLKNNLMPFVMLDESVNDENVDCIVTGNNDFGGGLAAKCLLSHGHKKIACITGPEDTPNSQGRLSGFLRETRRCGIEILHDSIVVGDYSVRGGYNAAGRLDPKKITAIFAFNDLSAIGAIKYFRENNIRVPGDISFIGYDNLEISRYLTPSLTTIDQKAELIGREGIKALIRKLRNVSYKIRLNVSPELVHGESIVRV